MKTKKFTYYLLISILFFSCSKSMDNQTPVLTKQTDQTLISKYLVKELPGTVLTITMDPVVTCYTYKNGETPKPCDITIEITCSLSNPINKGISVEINKITDAVNQKPASGDGAFAQAAAVSLMIAPNITHVTLRTNLTNPDNLNIADLFRLGNVSLVNPMND